MAYSSSLVSVTGARLFWDLALKGWDNDLWRRHDLGTSTSPYKNTSQISYSFQLQSPCIFLLLAISIFLSDFRISQIFGSIPDDRMIQNISELQSKAILAQEE